MLLKPDKSVGEVCEFRFRQKAWFSLLNQRNVFIFRVCVVIISIRPEVNRWQLIAVQSRLVLDPRWMGEREVNWTCEPHGGTWAAWAALACKIIKKKWSKLHSHMWWPKSSSTAAAALDEWSRSWSWPSATIWSLLLLARWLVGWSAETCHWVWANRCQHALYVAHCGTF